MNTNNNLQHHGTKGMKWGHRRYQNKDGSLTEAGKRRYARDQRELSDDKKGKDPDPDRWVREDLGRAQKVAGESSKMASQLSKTVKSATKTQKLDLSKMTDQEMRSEINRALLEKQYNDLFAPKKVSKGKEYTRAILDGAAITLGLTSTALGIALSIKQL